MKTSGWKKMNGSLPYKKNIEEKTRWSGKPFRTSPSCVYCCSLSLNLSFSLSLSLSLSLSPFCLCSFISPVHSFGCAHYGTSCLYMPPSITLSVWWCWRKHHTIISARTLCGLSASLYYLYAPLNNLSLLCCILWPKKIIHRIFVSQQYSENNWFSWESVGISEVALGIGWTVGVWWDSIPLYQLYSLMMEADFLFEPNTLQ